MAHLEEVRAATALPVLRKDFVLDPWQVWEARAAGADAVLLIVAALTDAELAGSSAAAREAGLDALVEVHDRAELDRALAAGSRIVGVNNRDLKTLAVSLETSLALAPAIPDDVVAVAESGIRTRRRPAAGCGTRASTRSSWASTSWPRPTRARRCARCWRARRGRAGPTR